MSSSNGRIPKPAATSQTAIVAKDGQWLPSIHNSILWLNDRVKKPVRYDTFRALILVGDKPLTDEITIGLTAKIEAETGRTWTRDHVWCALLRIAHDNEFSSLTEWLDSLQWDGTDRLPTFFQAAYDCEASTEDERSYLSACARVLFGSAVARAYQPGAQADVMVVLTGDQGLGKSTGIAALCPNPDWFADDIGADLADKRSGEGLRGKWLIEFSEFNRISRATNDTVKAFLSRRIDHYRPPYGRIAKDFPRYCTFCGSTNDPHPLQDRENRRFMPVSCKRADREWILDNRDQLWAEAVRRYENGEPWWISDLALLETVTHRQESARAGDFWEEELADMLAGKDLVSRHDVMDALKIDIDRADKSMQIRIGLALKAIGFTRRRRGGRKDRHYVWERD
jgi:predicted P-loop ATPase